MLLFWSLPLTWYLAQISTHQVCVACSVKPLASRERSRGSSRQEEEGNGVGLVEISRESCPGTLHKEASSIFSRGMGALPRVLGEVEAGEVTSRKGRGACVSEWLQVDQEGGTAELARPDHLRIRSLY